MYIKRLKFHKNTVLQQVTKFIITGHIQIAQVPDRGEPDSQGEINYKYIFELLQTLKYNSNVGLEYIPKGTTVGGLAWISEYNLKM